MGGSKGARSSGTTTTTPRRCSSCAPAGSTTRRRSWTGSDSGRVIPARDRGAASGHHSLHENNSLAFLHPEPIGVEEQLRRALDVILSIPWFARPARGEILLVGGDDGALVLEAQRGLPSGGLSRCDPTPSGRCFCGRAPQHREVVFASGPDGE